MDLSFVHRLLQAVASQDAAAALATAAIQGGTLAGVDARAVMAAMGSSGAPAAQDALSELVHDDDQGLAGDDTFTRKIPGLLDQTNRLIQIALQTMQLRPADAVAKSIGETASALGVPVRGGRPFERPDQDGERSVLVLSDTAARFYTPPRRDPGDRERANGDRRRRPDHGRRRCVLQAVDPQRLHPPSQQRADFRYLAIQGTAAVGRRLPRPGDGREASLDFLRGGPA